MECKPQERLVALAAEQPNRYRLDDAGRWTCPPGETYAAVLGLTYQVFSSAEINWIQQRNWAFLADYFADSCPAVAAGVLTRVLAVLEDEPDICLGRLRQRLEGLVNADELHVLIATAHIYVDLGAHALAEPNTVPVFRNSELAAAYALAAVRPDPLAVGAPALVRVAEGGAVRWDGRPWTIGPVTNTHTTLVSEQGDPVQLRTTAFVAYVREGRIIGVETPVDADAGVTEQGRALFAQASLADQAKANQRYAILRPHLEEGVSLDACGDPIPRSTKFAWAKRWREAEQRFGHGYLGLLDHLPGATRPRQALSEEVQQVLHSALDTHYATHQHKRKRRAYAAFLQACQVRDCRRSASALSTGKRGATLRPTRRSWRGQVSGRRAPTSRQRSRRRRHPATATVPGRRRISTTPKWIWSCSPREPGGRSAAPG